MVLDGSRWISMDFNGSRWISMDFEGYRRILTDFDVFCIFSAFEPRFVQFWGMGSSNPGPVLANSAWGAEI